MERLTINLTDALTQGAPPSCQRGNGGDYAADSLHHPYVVWRGRNFDTGYAEVFVGTGWSYREPISFGFYIEHYDTPESVVEQINRHLPYYMEQICA